MFTEASYADIPEFGAAHATDERAGTGCTVFVAPEGAIGAVDVRGGGPATRETDLLRPENMVQSIQAVVLSGGSAFGLEAACGAMEALAAEGLGFKVATACVPIVCGASLFDLLVGGSAWPDKEMGRRAAEDALASRAADLAMGNVGAGTGATVGKMGLPQQAMKAGFGWMGLRLGELVVVANVAVNALGNVMGPDGAWIAGVQDGQGNIMDPYAAAMSAQAAAAAGGPVTNTTLGCVLTNAELTQAQATKVSQITQDAYARAIRPVHTLNDGDTVFTMASGKAKAAPDLVAMLATEAMQGAIVRAVMSAQSAYGLVAACDLVRS